MNVEPTTLTLVFLFEFLLLVCLGIIIFILYRKRLHKSESHMISSFEKFIHQMSSLDSVKDVVGKFVAQMISHEHISQSAFAVICKNGLISNKLGFNVQKGCLDNIELEKHIYDLLTSHKNAFLYSPKLLEKLCVNISSQAEYLLITPFEIEKNHFMFVVFFKHSKLKLVQRSMINFYCSQVKLKLRELFLEEATEQYKKSIGSIEKSFVNVLEKSPNGLVIVNKNHEIVYSNGYSKQVLGIKSGKGSLLDSYIADKEARKTFSLMLNRLFSGSTQLENRERFFLQTSGSKRGIYDVSAYPIKTDVKTFHVVFMIRNKTQQYTLERELQLTQELATKELQEKVTTATAELVATNQELRRANKIKSEFVSTISHELRTPLTSIKGYISLLHSGKLGPIDEQQKQSLDIVMQESDRLADLINDILDFSRLESGKTSLKIKKQNLNDTVQYVVDSFTLEAKKKGIDFSFRKNNRCAKVPYDESKMKQVLVNLVNNAIKFSPSKTTITLSLRKDSHFCYVSVTDQGKGIPKKSLNTIFDPFHQLAEHQTEEIKGTGLGLAIVKNIIDLHKGSISVESEVGVGTTFTITLPFSSNENKF